jgi:hypothetical protein
MYVYICACLYMYMSKFICRCWLKWLWSWLSSWSGADAAIHPWNLFILHHRTFRFALRTFQLIEWGPPRLSMAISFIYSHLLVNVNHNRKFLSSNTLLKIFTYYWLIKLTQKKYVSTHKIISHGYTPMYQDYWKEERIIYTICNLWGLMHRDVHSVGE